MRINILYFAKFRESFGVSCEVLDIDPEKIKNIKDVLNLLRQRGEEWSSMLASDQVFKCAINQEFVDDFSIAIKENSEIAIFPPITGG